MDSVKFQGKRTLKWAAVVAAAALVVGYIALTVALGNGYGYFGPGH